jgi:hypothetical protein
MSLFEPRFSGVPQTGVGVTIESHRRALGPIATGNLAVHAGVNLVRVPPRNGCHHPDWLTHTVAMAFAAVLITGAAGMRSAMTQAAGSPQRAANPKNSVETVIPGTGETTRFVDQTQEIEASHPGWRVVAIATRTNKPAP